MEVIFKVILQTYLFHIGIIVYHTKNVDETKIMGVKKIRGKIHIRYNGVGTIAESFMKHHA